MGDQRPAPTNFEALRKDMLGRNDELSRQLQRIGRFAIDNPDVVALETVTSLAQRADVQPSAIVRFAKAFGFDGYSSMQQVFRQNLLATQDSYRDRIKSLSKPAVEAPQGLLSEFVSAAIGSLNRLEESSASHKIDAAVSLLSQARDIHLLGHRRASAVAEYLFYALSRLECRCLLADGAGGMLEHQLARCGPEDAVIAISFTPYTEAVLEQAGRLAASGVSVIAITDSPLSPLARASTVSFEISEGDTAFRSLAAPMCLAQTMVVALGQKLTDAGKKTSKT